MRTRLPFVPDFILLGIGIEQESLPLKHSAGLPASQVHGLALVRSSEDTTRSLAGATFVCSATIRLSLILLSLRVPCSVHAFCLVVYLLAGFS